MAATFIVFQWNGRYCTLQNNVTMYCWGQRRSGAIEHVLERYGWTHSPQLYRVSSKMVDRSQWRWLQHIFVTVQRLFDNKETGDTVGRVHWLNIMDCRLVFELLRRECYHHCRNLYPKASMLPSFMKSHGVEVESWPDWYSVCSVAARDTATPTPSSADDTELALPGTPSSGSSSSSAAHNGLPPVDSTSTAIGDREWLSDVHIANLMFLLLHGQLVLPLEMRDLFQYVYPMTDELFVLMLGRADADVGQDTDLGQVGQDDPHRTGTPLMHAKVGGGVTFAFINPNNNHWRLIVLDGMRQQVVLFDPLGTALPQPVTAAISRCMGPAFHIVDLQSSLQAEGWNCGVWALFIASKYVHTTSAAMAANERMAHERLANEQLPNEQLGEQPAQFQPRNDEDEYTVLDTHCTAHQRQQNRQFAQQLRRQYATLLVDAEQSGRLLYTASDVAEIVSGDGQDGQNGAVEANRTSMVRAGMARPAVRGIRFINVPVNELVWIDLTDDVGATEVEREEEVEQSYEELADNFIEFREDNIGKTDAASLRYSLPAKLQSDVLQQQIDDFRAYRRQRFSLFRRGPLVEETTISGNVKALLRFLGYLHYECSSELAGSDGTVGALLDMGVFTLPDISSFVLGYVEWLEQRRGSKRRVADADADDRHTFQPVSCATVCNYLNGLVSIVKYQLRQEPHLRDPLLDQLRNLRSQAESYTATQKRFDKVHPEWCTWQQLQVAREKCRAAFDQAVEVSSSHLRELCLLCLFTICPPPRCSIIRLLEWDKTLVAEASGRWVVDLTNLSHAASRHKTHKRKGALRLPLPRLLDPYLTKLRHSSSTSDGSGPVFPARSSTTAFMNPTPFTKFVKATFGKYTEGGKAPNPSLLRSIFTTWLYGLRYDTEDTFLAQIKASSARWKAHTEQIAATVYNKELVYQQREFAVLLQFCEAYSSRYAYDASTLPDANAGEPSSQADNGIDSNDAEQPRRKRRLVRKQADDKKDEQGGVEADRYVVEEMVDVRVNKQGEKQVLVKWEGYRRRTWESYSSMKEQLPVMVAELERQLAKTGHTEINGDSDNNSNSSTDVRSTFLHAYISEHHIDARFRWVPDRVIALEVAASLQEPPIKDPVHELIKAVMSLVQSL